MNCLFTALDFCNDDLSSVMPSTLSRETHMSNSDTKLFPWIPLVFDLQVQLQKASKATTTMYYKAKHRFCQILSVRFPNFSREKRINRDIFGQKLRMEDVSLIYFSFTNWQFLCNYLLLCKPSKVVFVKTQTWFWQISQMRHFFAFILVLRKLKP